MAKIPDPGSRGPRRGLRFSEDTVAKMLSDARKARDRHRRAETVVKGTRADLARHCLELYDAGLSLKQIGDGLDMSRREVQGLVEQARQAVDA